MNKKLLALVMMISFGANAESQPEPFPSTTRGIQMVPMAKLGIPDELKNKIMLQQNQEKMYGYQYSNDENARLLLTMEDIAPQEIKENKISKYGKYDTHLKESWSEIPLAIPFKGISFIDKKDVIGYAAIGSYVKEKNREGWNGIKEFFISPLGVCEYSYNEILAVQLDEETTEYLINKKPSSKFIAGNPNSGFIYSVGWYTNNSASSLDCANKKYIPDMMNKVIALANRIDRDLNSKS